MGEIVITAETVYWIELGRHEGQAQLAIFVPLSDLKLTDQLPEIGLYALDHTLGEFAEMTRVGALKFTHYSLAIPGPLPLTELPSHLESTGT